MIQCVGNCVFVPGFAFCTDAVRVVVGRRGHGLAEIYRETVAISGGMVLPIASLALGITLWNVVVRST